MAQLSFWFAHADQFCLEALTTPNVSLTAVWDSDPERGRAKAAEFGVPFESDLDALLSRDDVDAVSLCAEPFRHPELVEASAQAGKYMLVEKPMAGDLAGADRIVRAVENSAVQLLPAFNLRYHPVALRIKQLVDEGIAGRLWRVRRLHGHSRAYERANFDGELVPKVNKWGDPAAEHRDSLFFAGSHAALWFEWMFGPPDSVLCARGTVSPGLPVEDHSVALLRYRDGMLGIMDSSEALLAQGMVTEIYGTEGVILQLRGNLPSTRISSPSMTPLLIFRRSENAWEVPALPPQFLRHEMEFSSPRQFFRCLLEGKPFPMNVYDGYDSIAILVAAERAAESGREVPVESWPRPLAASAGAESCG